MTTTRQLIQFSPDDDLLHDDISASGPYARESLLLTAPIPDEQLLVFPNLDGEVSPIVSAEASVDLDDNMVQGATRGRFVDEQGREMTLEAYYSAGWSMPIQHLLLNEIAMAATLNGAPAVAHVELGWPADYVRNLTQSSG